MTRRGTAPVHAVILAGGAGERFWPASRRARPKPLLRVLGDRTLLDATLERARRVARDDRVWVVCGTEHASAIRRETGLSAGRVLVEPRRRNTAMAVAWAAHRIYAQDPEAVLVVLPADHHVPDVRAFTRDVRLAARAAAAAGVLVTLGVQPTRPETGYGYIQSGPPAPGFPELRRVRRFVEKPNLATARRYLRRGGYWWNAGIFVWKAAVVLEEIERHAPELHRALGPLRPGRPPGGGRRPRPNSRAALERAYRRAPALPIDVAVLERSKRVWTLPVSFRWSDVGTWASLAEELGVGRPGRESASAMLGNRVLGGEAILAASRNNLVWSNGRLVVLLGVEDLAVVDTEDVILVTKLGAGSDVRALVETLRAAGRYEFI